MTETNELFVAIKTVEHKVNAMNANLEWLLKINGEKLKEAFVEELKKDENLKAVYLEIDGFRTGTEISEILINKGIKISQPTVSRKLSKLEKEIGLIELVNDSRGKVYKKRSIDYILGLSAELED